MKHQTITLEGERQDGFTMLPPGGDDGTQRRQMEPQFIGSYLTRSADRSDQAEDDGTTSRTPMRPSAAPAEFAIRRESEIAVLGLTARELESAAAPWEMFAAALRNKIAGLASFEGLQVTGSPLSADWNHPSYGNFTAWRVLGDSVPAWGPTYRPGEAQVSTAYYLFITNLDIPLPDKDEKRKAEKARERFLEEVEDLESAQEKVGPNWKRFNERQMALPENRRLPFDEWYRRFDGNKIASLTAKVKVSEQEYTSYLIKAYRGFAFAADLLTNYNNPAFQLSAESPTGEMSFYRTYAITPSLSEFIARAKGAVAAAAPPELEFAFTKDSTRIHTERTVWGASARWFGGFFGFGGRAGGETSVVNVQHDHFRMNFSARAFTTFTITPGQWFNGTAIKALKDGPWLPGGPVATGRVQLWGPDGLFPLVSKQLVVAFRPKVSASVSRDEFLEVKSRFYAGGGFSIGPFGFGGSYERATSDVSFDESTNSIRAEDTSDVPQIMAVVSNVLPKFT